MSVIVTLTPITNDIFQDLVAWLQLDDNDAKKIRFGHYPTLEELIDASKISGYVVEDDRASSFITIVDANGVFLRINIRKISKNSEDKRDYGFTGEAEILEKIIKFLPYSSGSFLITTEGDDAKVVHAGDNK